MSLTYIENKNKTSVYLLILLTPFYLIDSLVDTLYEISGFFNRRNKINAIYKSIKSDITRDEVKNIITRYIPDFLNVLKTEVDVKFQDVIYCSGSNRIIYILKINNIDSVMFMKINKPSIIIYDKLEFQITHFNAIQINRIVEEMVGL